MTENGRDEGVKKGLALEGRKRRYKHIEDGSE